jgi:hypothetical protein
MKSRKLPVNKAIPYIVGHDFSELQTTVEKTGLHRKLTTELSLQDCVHRGTRYPRSSGMISLEVKWKNWADAAICSEGTGSAMVELV